VRLLLVDDEVSFLRSLARYFQKKGLDVASAENGQEALSILGRTAVDVVVSDVKMPGISGLELLARIKQEFPETEVILLTGAATTQDGVEGMRAGAFDYLSKPIEPEHLLGKIEQAWDRIQRRRDQLREAEFRARLETQMMAAEKLASLGTLAAGVAHEINNPLAIIYQAAEWLRLILKSEDMANSPRRAELEKAVTKINESVVRAKRITHQLLSFVRTDDSIVAETDLGELAAEAIALVKSEAAGKDVEIVLQANPSLAAVRTDRGRLRQVLINLLTNAIAASPKGGRITVGLESGPSDAVLTVADAGPGIPEENLSRIFEPFFTTKPPGQGTGLGLFVARSIMDKLGGEIEVESRLGQGTVFRVSLPREAPAGRPVDEALAADWLQRAGEGLSAE